MDEEAWSEPPQRTALARLPSATLADILLLVCDRDVDPPAVVTAVITACEDGGAQLADRLRTETARVRKGQPDDLDQLLALVWFVLGPGTVLRLGPRLIEALAAVDEDTGGDRTTDTQRELIELVAAALYHYATLATEGSVDLSGRHGGRYAMRTAAARALAEMEPRPRVITPGQLPALLEDLHTLLD